jgi:hypothetical protein
MSTDSTRLAWQYASIVVVRKRTVEWVSSSRSPQMPAPPRVGLQQRVGSGQAVCSQRDVLQNIGDRDVVEFHGLIRSKAALQEAE